ncbi:hypothetical protein LTR28_005065 [Elasticomyces elasticus]|nr:hypothetical protein LTR28_005065 [Elasticomyces elasticus]
MTTKPSTTASPTNPLLHLSQPPAALLQQQASLPHRLVVSAFVFRTDPTRQEDRLLILQRSASERAFPHIWEIPGGSADASDASVAVAVARELREESGLTLARVVCAVGEGVEWMEGGTRWLKLGFIVEVERGADGGEAGGGGGVEAVEVMLNPEEHQRYLWVVEEEVRACQARGVKLDFNWHESRGAMLLAFDMKKQMRDSLPSAGFTGQV